MTVVAIDIDPQKTFTPICADELPVPQGDEIVAELNAQAALADLRAVSKDAHSPAAQWLCASHADILRPTRLPDAPESWVAHAMVGSRGFELLDGLPDVRAYDFCVWKGIEPDMHPYGACYHDHAGRLSTGLIEWLRDVRAQVLVVGGLATDFCVKESVLQLAKAGGGRRGFAGRCGGGKRLFGGVGGSLKSGSAGFQAAFTLPCPLSGCFPHIPRCGLQSACPSNPQAKTP